MFGWNKCDAKYIVISMGVPIIYIDRSYGIYWIINSVSFNGEMYTSSIAMLLLLLISSFITATGEEIGWRGFFLPKLSEMMNIKTAILVSAVIWALWHFPLMIAGLYQSGTVIWYQLISFTIEIIAVTTIMAYLRIKSQSVWPCIVLHAIYNYYLCCNSDCVFEENRKTIEIYIYWHKLKKS